jgi:hypothetical protein
MRGRLLCEFEVGFEADVVDDVPMNTAGSRTWTNGLYRSYTVKLFPKTDDGLPLHVR